MALRCFDSRAHFLLRLVRFACSRWRSLSGTSRRATLPVRCRCDIGLYESIVRNDVAVCQEIFCAASVFGAKEISAQKIPQKFPTQKNFLHKKISHTKNFPAQRNSHAKNSQRNFTAEIYFGNFMRIFLIFTRRVRRFCPRLLPACRPRRRRCLSPRPRSRDAPWW